MHRVLLLGAGKIGRMIAKFLVESGDYCVRVGDVDQSALRRLRRMLDVETILGSLAKTHRAVIVDEGWKTGSLAGEISALIMENGFDLLDWPVQRVCSAEVPVPYAKHLEDAALPNVERIVATVKAMA